MSGDTIKFSLSKKHEAEIKESITLVYNALSEKGYNAVNQLVGYILSEDPTYITTYQNARNIISSIDRDELLQAMFKDYLAISE